jgi:hypothetical protein
MEAGVAELERTVQTFERAVMQAEHSMDEIEQLVSSESTHDEPHLQSLTRSLQEGYAAAELVRGANAALNDTLTHAERSVQGDRAANDGAPLAIGTLICDGRYRVVQLLHRRPRVHLYLARRVQDLPGATSTEQSLVAIREIILADLAPEIRQRIVRAAFEEFAAPQLFGSPHLPGVGDHVYLEDERHYLVMQPRPARGRRSAFALPLAELLPDQAHPTMWPDFFTALHLGIRLCQTVARLHRVQTVLGEITPAMVLVNREGSPDWAPLLLASWPPAPSFWPEHASQEMQKLYKQVFPPVALTLADTAPAMSSDRVFAAPEIFEGRCDERSDIYALGAILYLLFTGSAPASSTQRLQVEQASSNARNERQAGRRARKGALRQTQTTEQTAQPLHALTFPHLLNTRISPLLEQILLRALALDPQQRFTSALDLAEALEGMYLRTDTPAAPTSLPQAKVSRLRRLLEWLKK